MRNKFTILLNFTILSILLPYIYGCGSGVGATFLDGLLGGGGSAVDGGSVLLASSGIEGGGATMAALHNPEPMTMALFGSGMLAMAFYKNRRK